MYCQRKSSQTVWTQISLSIHTLDFCSKMHLKALVLLEEMFTFCTPNKKEVTDQESIHSSTTPDPAYQWESAIIFKEENKVANHDWTDYQACSLLQYINVIANLFIMGHYLNELR